MLSCREVLDEINSGSDGLKEWCKIHKDVFVDTGHLIPLVDKIIKDYPQLVNPYALRETADPYLIVLARSRMGLRNMTPIIVTDKNTRKASRITHVAQSYDIQTCKLLDVSKRELGILKISILLPI